MELDPSSLDAHTVLTTGVCIIGAGAAGITLACELDGSGIPVLLLDAGSSARKPSQEAYAGTSDEPHPSPSHFRRLGFGGSTAIWGGRCVPYDPIDFEARDWVENSGWPIGYDEVARHYPAALAYCDAGAAEFDTTLALPGARSTLPNGAAPVEVQTQAIERYSLPTDFGRRWGPKLAASTNVSVLRGARALRLERDLQADRVTCVHASVGEPGPTIKITATHFVVATGGIETPRLLLTSTPGGLGNLNDLVGRYYTCHVENVIGVLRPTAPGVVFDFETTRDGVYARRKWLIDAAAQRRERLMNIAFRLHYPDVSDPGHGSPVLSAVYLAKRTLIPEYRRILQHGQATAAPRSLAHLRNVALGLPTLGAFGLDWLRRRVLPERKLPYVLVPNADGSFPIEFNAEQTPLPDSRITLGRERDAQGVPRVHIHWRMAEADVDSICRAYRLLQQRVQATGSARIDIDPAGLRAAAARSIPVGGHHIGTARMGATPRRGVVDGDCASFDLPNLHVAGAASFPTSSHANPTLTIVALAIRLAARLRHLSQPPAA